VVYITGPYANITQFNNHLDSYDHAHIKRTKALQQISKEKKQQSGEIEKRKERERKREEKELLKMTGGKKVSTIPSASTSGSQGMMASLPLPSGSSSSSTSGFQKGFAKIAPSTQTASTESPISGLSSSQTSDPICAVPEVSLKKTGGWAAVSKKSTPGSSASPAPPPPLTQRPPSPPVPPTSAFNKSHQPITNRAPSIGFKPVVKLPTTSSSLLHDDEEEEFLSVDRPVTPALYKPMGIGKIGIKKR